LEQLELFFDTEERTIHDLIKKKNDFQAEQEKKENQIRAILADHKLHFPHQPLTTVKLANISLLQEVVWIQKHIQDITREIEEREKATKKIRQETITKRLQHEHASAKELCKRAGIKISNTDDLTDGHDTLLGLDPSELSWNKYEKEVETRLQALQPPKRRPEEEVLERKQQERMRLEEYERRMIEQEEEEEDSEDSEEEEKEEKHNKKKSIRIATTHTTVPRN